MNDVAIQVSNLAKRYRIGLKAERYRTLREAITQLATAPFRRRERAEKSTYWALRDVTFELKRGDVLGIIGRNGAGKTTLLKILSRITEPTGGYAEIHGRVGSLLEVGTGFHPELTGRENIYLNGAILGMRRAEIERKLDEIVAFAEVETFIDTPVKRFSSGMYLRLAFAVAAHLEPEILMVDEVLAVGDVAFQKKCLGKMSEVSKQDRTILFVSHNMAAVGQLCRTVVWLENGTVKRIGRPAEVIAEYLADDTDAEPVWVNTSTAPSRGVRIESAEMLSVEGSSQTVFEFDTGFQIGINYTLTESIRDLIVVCNVTDAMGNVVWESYDTDTTDWLGRSRAPGHYRSTCLVSPHLLRPGRYILSVAAFVRNVTVYARHDHILSFEISAAEFGLDPDRAGIVTPLFNWDAAKLEAGESGAPMTPEAVARQAGAYR